MGALTVLSVAAWVSAIAGAGSGTAIITPSAPVAAGSTAKWSIVYTAAETIQNGRVRITVPTGFSAPQSSSSSSEGFVSVATNEPTGNPLLATGGQVVTIDVDTLTAGNTLTVVYGDDTADSGARATAATTIGIYPFVVASDPSGTNPSAIATSPALTVVAGAPDHIEIAPSDTTVVAGAFASYRLIVRDQFGNRAPVASSRTVNLFPGSGSFYTTPGHAPITSTSIASGKTSVRIDYRGTLASPSGSPHSLFVLTSGGSPTLAGSDDVNVVAGALSTSQSSVDATTPVVADGVTLSTVTVTSKDLFGNPRSGDNATISVTGSAQKNNPGSSTDTNGETGGTVSDTVAEGVIVSANINGQAITDTGSISFVAGAVSAAQSTVNATSPVVANGIATSTVTVTAKDANNNPIAGQSVTLAVAPVPNATLTQPGGVTNASGVVTGTLASTTVGNRTVTATIGATAITDNAIVSFTAGTIASFVWTVDGAATAGVAEAVTLTAKDAQGNIITNFTGTVNLSTNTTGAGDPVQWGPGTGVGTLNNVPGTDNATYTFAAGDNGVVQLNVTDTHAETLMLTAISGPASQTSGNIVVSAGPADVVQLLTGNGQSATVATAVATSPDVKVVDQFGNPVSGATVTFAIQSGGAGSSIDAIAGGGVNTTRPTAADGTAACDVWTLGNLVANNPNVLRASIASGTTPFVDFTATATAGAGTQLSIAPGSQSVTVGSSTILTATLLDVFNNPKSGDRIDILIKSGFHGTLASNGGDSNPTTFISNTARYGMSDANGKITVLYQAPVGSGLADVVDAFTSSVAQGSVADRTYTTVASGGTSYRITFVGPASAAAGVSFHFQIEAVDGGGNRDTSNNSTATLTPETGSGPLQFSLMDFGSTTTSIPLVNGIRDVYGRGTVVGNWDITTSGSLGSDLKAVDITPAPVDHYDIANISSATAGTNFSVSVTARDQFNNIATNANNAITLSAIQTGNNNPASSTLSVTAAVLSSGLVTVSNETYTFAESIRIRVSDSNSKIGTSNAFAVGDAGAHHIVKVSGDANNIIAGAGAPLIVQVLDQYNNPVNGATVNFAKLTGGGSIPASATTNASGNATQTLTTGTTVGAATVKATILDENPPALERVDFSVSTVAGALANYLVSPSKTNPVAHEDVTLTISGRDANNNVRVSDVTSVVTLSKGASSAVLAQGSGTLTNGVFTTTVHDDVAELFIVHAQTGGANGDSPSIVVTNAIADNVTKVSGDASGVTAGGTQPLTVLVKDLYNNPVANQVVTFSIASAPDGTASITDPTGDPNDGITVTNASGQAAVTYHTAATVGTNTINAQILDANPPAKERVTFTVNTAASGATKLVFTFIGPGSAAAGGSFQFKVEAKDASDNVVTSNNSLITLTPQLGSTLVFSTQSNLSSPSTTFNLVNGAKTLYGGGTKAGQWGINVDAAALTGASDQATVTDNGVIASYFLSSAASAQAGAAFLVDIEARDQYANRVMSANNVVFLNAVDDVSNTSTGVAFGVTQATLVSGAVTVNETYTKADLIRVHANAGGFEGFSNVVTIAAAAAYRVANLSGDSSGTIVAGNTRALTARVFDQYDNVVVGQLVSFSAPQGGGSVLPTSGSTNATGDVSTTLTTGTTVGTNIGRATILDGSPAALETADFTVTTIAGAINNYEVTTAKASLIANEVTNVTIKARDSNGNYRTQDSGTNIVIAHTGGATLGAASGTLSGGQFVTTVRDTVAQNFTVSAATNGSPGVNGTSPAVTVTNGPAYRIVYVSGSSPPSVPVGLVQPLRTEVRDQWGNTVPNEIVTYLKQSSPPGAFVADAVSDTSDGITTSVGNGRAVARLHTSTTAGASTVTASILDGSPAGRERVTFNVTSVAGGIAYYTVTMNFYSTTAGVSKTATVTAYDINNNPVDDDVTQVSLTGDPGTGLVFSPPTVTLTNGVATATVTTPVVQSYQVRASTVGLPSVTGLSNPVTVIPGNPSGAGTITASATQNTITATGTSTTTITSGVIKDAFGNTVAVGQNINVSANLGGVIVGGSLKAVDATGRISFQLQSSTSTGPCTVNMASALGSATGSIGITFAPKPSLACNTPPTPSIVVPGGSAAFSVQADNASTTSVNLTTATTFTFSDGTHSFSANLAAPQTVPASGSVTLVFNSATVNAAFVTASYAPTVNLIGTDQFGSSVNAPCVLPAASLLVTSIEITSIVPASGMVSRGTSTTIAVTVKNNGSQSTTIDDVDLVFIPSDLFTIGDAPENGQSVNGGASRTFNVPVTVQAGATAGTYQIDASASGTVNSQPVIDPAVAPHPRASIEVTQAANLAYEPATLSPTTVSRGDAYSFEVTIRNTGGGLVQLDSTATRLTFTDGTRTYSAAPSQPFAIPADNATQTLTFRSKFVPNAFTPGSYAATLNAHGKDNGADFTQAVPLTGSPVTVQAPALISESGADALKPDAVSKTTTATFTVLVMNSGGATVVLDPATTTIKFASNQYSAALNPTGAVALPPGTTTLEFLGATVSNAIAMATYHPTVQLTGTENGNAFSQSINLADGVVVQNAPAIAITAMTPSQAQFTADQTGTIQVHMVVSNTSAGAAANFSSASLRFIHAGIDRTNQFTVSTPSSFTNGALLSAGETDEVVFNVSDNTGNAMSAGNMTIEGALVVTDVNTSQPINVDTDLGGKGNLQVMTPAAITFDAITVSKAKVTANLATSFKVRAIARNTGGSDVTLNLSNAATQLSFSPAPAWVSTVKSTLGNGGTVLSGGEVDTLIFTITNTGSAAGATAISVATSGTENNSNRPVNGAGVDLASILVQTPGTIQVTNVTPSRSSITNGSTINWTATATLTNSGQSDIDLALGAGVGVTLTGATTQPAHTTPATLAGGGVTLSGGETDQITISFTTAGTYASPGVKNIALNFNGTELNSGQTRNGSDNSASVIVQQVPDVGYLSLVPATVSKGATALFVVSVQNTTTPNGATITLDRSLTRMRFGSNQFNVGLTAGSPVDLPSGGFANLAFTGGVVPAGVPNGLQADAQLELHWIQNGVPGTKTINIGDQITVVTPPALSIVSVRPSRSTMSRQQLNAGTVTMVLRNTGGAAVDLDLAPATTHLGFKLLSSGATIPASEYTIQAPGALESAGGTTLASGATDSLVFNIAQAGTTTGAIIVNGYAGGIDQNSLQPVTDDTFDGGSGSFVLQMPGVLDILSITPAQPTATMGQTGAGASYAVKMAVKNTGEAAIDVNLGLANSFLQFPGTNGWVVSAPTMSNGVTLSGGETDDLTFMVTTTGGPAGAATISGTVGGTENNTGAGRTNSATGPDNGSITLQTQATLVVDSVTPSQPSITAPSAVGWDTTIKLHNTGQSDARLTLPSGFTIAVQSSTGGMTFVKPVDLEEGGVVLAGGASGTLLAHANNTGTFSTTGSRQINVTVTGTEVNSTRPLSVPFNGSVIVQTAPNLAVVAIRPTQVTSGAQVDFEVDVRNPGTDAATVHLNRATTRARFASNAFSAVLDVASPDSIVGGDTVTLRFESKVVPASIAPAAYNFNVDLDYTANRVAMSEPEVVNNGVTVLQAPKFFIQQIATSQPTVTASQGADWTATMNVVNNGTSNITLDLSPAKTFLTFVTPQGPSDNTYTVSAPVMVGGGNTLAAGTSGQLQFTVTQTGVQTGSIVINGKTEGHDINNVLVSDDTFDGGRGGVVVQTPAVVAITAIHPSQPIITQGQNLSVRIVIANTGGSDVVINLPGSDANFTPGGWGAGPTTLAGGGNVLEGGAVDSLLIQETSSNTVGVTRIDGVMPWTESNSSRTGTANTTSSGFGAVRIEEKANLRVLATTSASPNPAAVNENQNFNVQVTIQNTGEADAKNVMLALATNGASTIPPPVPMVPVVPGGQSVAYLIPVKAAAAPNAAEKFTASVTSAIDENSGEAGRVNYSTAVDNNTTLEVDTPAALDILHARPSQPSVTRGQANPWSVTVAVRNPGQADVNLTPPAAADLDFSIAGATKLDYIVQPPTKFATGATGWTLAGGATDSLTYNVTTTGQDTGTVDIHLGVAGSDRNDPPHTVNDTGVTHVRVQDVAGLFIASTFPVGTFNHIDASRDIVNTSFPFEVHVTVQNAGGEDVDSVRVQLASSLVSNNPSAIAPATLKGLSIAAGASREWTFRITARNAVTALESFHSTVSGARSHNTGLPIPAQQALDDKHDITVQTRADLSLNLFVASPPGSAGGVVGVNQVFTLGAKVSNQGQAALASTGTVTLTIPGTFGAPTEPPAQSFAVGDTVRWSFTAPASTQAPSNFSCTISNPVPNDVNTAAAAFVSKLTDTQSITVTSGGGLVLPDVSITTPAGAVDDTISVAQQPVKLTASITTNHVKSLVGTLSVPGSYTVLGSGPVFNFPNGTGPRSTTFNLLAPALPSASDNVFVTFTALDSITGNPVPSAADTVRITVVPRTSLSIIAAVTAPPAAMDNTVAIGTPFTVSATVSNAMGAADATGAGNLTITMPAKYTLANGQTAAKPFTTGVPVSWIVNAAQQPSGPDQITVAITTVPLDENSGQTAQVTTGSANIAMVTEGSAVAVKDVSSSKNVGTPVAPGGGTKLGVLAFEVAYKVTDTNVPPAEVDTVAITIIDKTGAPLGPSVVAQTLKRVALDLGGAQPYEVLNPSTNPVLVSLVSGGNDRMISPNGSIDATVLLDLDPSPRATELRVNVLGGGMIVRDPQSNQRLGVTNGQGQALDIKSGPLVILSSNFEEYAHNYPNPFSAGGEDTKIAYFLDAPANISIKIYSITGDLVHEEDIPSGDPRAQAGPRETTWDGRNDKGEVVRNGVYVCVLNAGSKSAKFRIAVAK